MTPHIVVLGAGYSGLAAAGLAARAGARVTLVNSADRFVERVRMHQLASGQALKDRPLAGLLAGTGVGLVIGRATAIDPDARSVVLDGGARELGYDGLIYAVGSHADMNAVPGVAEHAYTVADAPRALRLRGRLQEAESVAVIGGGPTGIETAAEVAESHPRLTVRLVAGARFGEMLSPAAQGHLRRVFDRLGVEVHTGARVSKAHAHGVDLEDGGNHDADTLVWTTGFTVPALAADSGLAVDGRGRMLVDETLRSVSHPKVYGVGDAAAVRTGEGAELRMACATALPSAVHAVRAITARRLGRAPRPLRFRYFNHCISLGRRDGLIQFVHADDSPRAVMLTGRSAARYKEAVVRGAAFAMRRTGLLSVM